VADGLLATASAAEGFEFCGTWWLLLKPGGTFTAFQYVHAYALPPAIAFRQDLSARFGGAPSRRLVLRNIPPAFVLRWTRQSKDPDRTDSLTQ
jgi:phospholipid N-methyltransferase